MEPTYLLATLPVFVAPLSLLSAALVVALVPGRDDRRVTVVALLALFVAALMLIASAPAVLTGSVVIDPVLRMFRSGSLDVLLGCVLDKVSLLASVAVLVCVSGFVVAAAFKSLAHRQVALALALGGGAMLAALSEGFPTLLFGLSLTFWLSHLAADREPPQRLRSLGFVAGVTSSLLAVAFTFWSLGGQWLDDSRYLADFKARFAVTSAPGEQVKRPSGMRIGQGELTIVSHPGARVYLGVVDEAQLKRSEPIGVTPLVRHPVPAGLQKVAIEPGGSAIVGGEGVEVALVDTLEVRDEGETVISLVGPTVSFHELAPMLRAGTFATRRVGRSSVGVVVGALLCFSVCAFLLAFAERARGLTSVFGRGCLLIAIAVLLARLGPLTSASPALAVGGALLVAAFAVWTASRGAGPWFSAAALLGGAAFAGAPVAAVVIAAAIAPGMLALAELEGAPRLAVEPAAPRAGSAKKKKKQKVEAPAPPPVAARQTGSALSLTRVALALAPLPFLGPFAGIGSAIATPFSSSFGLGVAFWIALGVTWAAFAWCLQQELRPLSGVALDPRATRRASVLAGIAAVAGPLFVIVLRPWTLSAAFGPILALCVAAAASAIVFITAPLAARHSPGALGNGGGEAPERLARIDAALDKLDMLLGLPLALVARLLSRSEKGASP